MKKLKNDFEKYSNLAKTKFGVNIEAYDCKVKNKEDNYKITNVLSGVSVEIDTPILYTSPTNFTLEYSQSAVFEDNNISAGGLIVTYSPTISSSIGTILSQSSYVGNIFYEQGIGVLTQIPKSLYL